MLGSNWNILGALTDLKTSFLALAIKLFVIKSIYLDFLHPTHAFPNTTIIKNKSILIFCAQFVITFSINIKMIHIYIYIYNTQYIIYSLTQQKIYPFFWKRNLATWDGKIPFWKCSSPTISNLFSSVTSNVLSMIPSVSSLKLCKKKEDHKNF